MKLIFILFTLMLPSTIWAQQTKLSSQAKSVMNQFLAQFLELQPFMASGTTLTEKKEKDRVAKELERLSRLSLQLRKIHQFESPSFQISAELLTNELQNASRAFSKGNLSYARRALRSTLDVCSSCHSQVPDTSHRGWIFDEAQLKGSSFQKAEFLFATRQYVPAIKNYREFVGAFTPEQNAMDLDLALSHLLAIQVRSLRNLKAARTELSGLAKKSNYSEAQRLKIQGWLTELRQLERLSSPNLEKISAADLVKFVSSRLDAKEIESFSNDPRLVPALYYSGLLYQFINTRPKKDLSGELLYWLAHYESRLGENYPIELSRLYLKECVLQFSADPAAQKCFQEYETLTTLDYTGSAGTVLPADVKKEIELLRLKLPKAEKK
jgi:hypothetical protein